ncbi:thiol:disulfide interchange protein DsbA/DsbL [Thiomonas sp. X19]|uniref:thiol:disulfide interchange protein DsbA/DsbL n=1 Tax=Thiomonas sp. X19 TaxID=1050370 RepID=UPI000DD88A06|nr:thiol:disulfide interchange protein DsbA/DsbL [Thiomonas sp. X19]
MNRWFARIAALLLLGFSVAANAAGAAPFQEGAGYNKLPSAQPVGHKGKIVVTEFFWYDCPHCFEFEPLLEAWAKKQPADVVLERVPVAFAPQYVAQQKLYYALKALGKVDALQGAIFNAIHVQHIPLGTPEQMANWLVGRGIPKATFMNAYNSFGVQMETKRATQMVTDYQITGVPTLAVGGMYTASASMPETPNNEKVLQAVDFLVQQLRAGMAKTAK